jgi:hypothetical protein
MEDNIAKLHTCIVMKEIRRDLVLEMFPYTIIQSRSKSALRSGAGGGVGEGVDSFDLAQVGDKWQVLVNAVMN